MGLAEGETRSSVLDSTTLPGHRLPRLPGRAEKVVPEYGDLILVFRDPPVEILVVAAEQEAEPFIEAAGGEVVRLRLRADPCGLKPAPTREPHAAGSSRALSPGL